MSYNKKIWYFSNSAEIEYTEARNYGAEGLPRAEKANVTPAQMQRQNQWQKQRNTRRLIKANFKNGDVFCTLKYSVSPSVQDVKRDFTNFIRVLKRKYKKKSCELKYIYRVEISDNDGIHIHFLCNALQENMHDLLHDAWGRSVYLEYIREQEADFRALANYITKKPNDAQEILLKNYSAKERKILLSVNSSRNLVRPVPAKEKCSYERLQHMLANGIETIPGYYIDEDSVHMGYNYYTGAPYLKYTALKIPGNDHCDYN
jgi:hypothetical protein